MSRASAIGPWSHRGAPGTWAKHLRLDGTWAKPLRPPISNLKRPLISDLRLLPAAPARSCSTFQFRLSNLKRASCFSSTRRIKPARSWPPLAPPPRTKTPLPTVPLLHFRISAFRLQTLQCLAPHGMAGFVLVRVWFWMKHGFRRTESREETGSAWCAFDEACGRGTLVALRFAAAMIFDGYENTGIPGYRLTIMFTRLHEGHGNHT